MKKLLMLAIASIMAISFTACGNDEKDTDEKKTKITPAIEGVNDTAENVALAFYNILYDEESTYKDLEKLIAPHEEYLEYFSEEEFTERRNKIDFEVLSIEVTDSGANYAEETIEEYAENLAENGYELEELTSVDLEITIKDYLDRVETIKKEVSAVKTEGKWYIGVEYYIR